MVTIDDLLEKNLKQLSSDFVKERRLAARILGKIGKKEATLSLLDHLDDSSESVQKAVIKSLKEIGDNRAIKPLIDFYNTNPSVKVKAVIAWTLGHFIYDDFDLGFLLNSLDDNSIYLRKKVIFALGNKSYQKSIPHLIQIAESQDEDNRLRQLAMWALAQMNDRNVLKPIFKALNDSNEKIRRRATRSLHSSPYTFVHLEYIFKKIDNKDFRGILNVIHLIGQMGYYPAIPRLISLVRTTSDINLKEASVLALSKMKDARIYRLFVELLDDPSEFIRSTVIISIKYNHNLEVDVIAKVIDKLNTETSQVQLAIIYFIHAIVGTLSIPIELYDRIPKMITIAKSAPDERVRGSMQSVLMMLKRYISTNELDKINFNRDTIRLGYKRKRDIKRRKPIDPIDELPIPEKSKRRTSLPEEITNDIDKLLSIIANESCWLLRWKAIVALTKYYTDTRIIEPLIKASKDPHNKVRMAALYCLHKTKNPKALDTLIEALNDVFKRVRKTVAFKLSTNFNIEKQVPLLLQKLEDKSFLGRIQIVSILKDLESDYYLDIFLEILNHDNDYELRHSITYSFAKHKDERILNALVENFKNPADRIREATLSVLLYGPHNVKTKKEYLLKQYSDRNHFGRYELFYLLSGERKERAICSDDFIIEGLYSRLFYLKRVATVLPRFHGNFSLIPKDYNEIIRLH